VLEEWFELAMLRSGSLVGSFYLILFFCFKRKVSLTRNTMKKLAAPGSLCDVECVVVFGLVECLKFERDKKERRLKA
jgi:hypothetical protein